jgi:hypothetical protein
MYNKPTMLFINNHDFYDYNSNIHLGFVVSLNKYFNIIEIGNSSGLFKKSILEFSERSLRKACRRFKPKVLLTYNSNGSSKGKENYNRFAFIKNVYKDLNVIKAHITTDHCREGDVFLQRKWFEELGIDIAFFRHKNFKQHPVISDSYWLPFSVDESLFRRNSFSFDEKKNKVVFLGTTKGSVYKKRRKAISFLRNKGNIDDYKNLKIMGKDYVKTLSQYNFGLACGGTCNFFTAKYLEILAAGTFLYCSDTDGLEIIPDEYYIKYDSENMAVSYSRIKNLRLNLKHLKNTTDSAKEFVFRNHSNEVRGEFLLEKILEKT